MVRAILNYEICPGCGHPIGSIEHQRHIANKKKVRRTRRPG